MKIFGEKKEFKEDLNFFHSRKSFHSGLKMQIIAITFTIYPFLFFFISLPVAAKFSQEFDILPTFLPYWMVTFWSFCYSFHYSLHFSIIKRILCLLNCNYIRNRSIQSSFVAFLNEIVWNAIKERGKIFMTFLWWKKVSYGNIGVM